MSTAGGFVQIVIIGGWVVALLIGSVAAFRAKRTWATWLLLVGAVGQVVGIALFVAGAILLTRRFSGGAWAGPGIEQFVMLAGAIAAGLSIIAFAAGFIGLCLRYGAVEQRAADLEALNGHLQERLGAGS